MKMIKLTFCEKVILCVCVFIILLCTALALILGYMIPSKSTVKMEKYQYYKPSRNNSKNIPEERVKVNIVKRSIVKHILNDKFPKAVTDVENKEHDLCICPEPPLTSNGCVVPQKSKPLFKEIKKAPTTKVIEVYPYLVSLSVPIYADESHSFKFLCTGVALEPNKVITGSCVGQQNYLNVTVRSGVDQWSHGGKEHKITNFKTSKIGLTVIALDKPINCIFPELPSNEFRWKTAKLVGWERDPLVPLKENVPVVKSIKSKDLMCGNGFCTSGAHQACDERNIGQPMVSSDVLLGMVSGISCDQFTKKSHHVFKIADMREPANKMWVQKELLQTSGS